MTPLKTNFFIQPWRGFTDQKRGRTEQELDHHEARIGFKLPTAYRALMRQQNGGSVRYKKINGFGEISLYGGFSALRTELAHPITNFRDYMLLTCDEEEIVQATQALAPFHPERLVLFSSLDGHSAAYFDYGYRQTEPLETPGVVFISDDGDDFLHFSPIGHRFPDFDTFLRSLSVDDTSVEDICLGLAFNGSYDAAVALVAQHLDLELQAYDDDDRNGNWDFARWHSTHLPLELTNETLATYAQYNDVSAEDMQSWAASEGHVRHVYSIFSPNQHRSGTYRFHDHPDLSLVIEIRKSWFPMQQPVSSLKDKLRSIPELVRLVDLP